MPKTMLSVAWKSKMGRVSSDAEVDKWDESRRGGSPKVEVATSQLRCGSRKMDVSKTMLTQPMKLDTISN